MTQPMTEASTARLVAAEFVGTVLVMLGGPGLLILAGDDIGNVGVAIGFGASVAIAIGVIGAVANPMFSLALWFARGIPGRELLADLGGQLLGGIFGAALIFGMNDTNRFRVGTNGWEAGSVDAGVDLGISLSGFSDLGVVLAAELTVGTLLVTVLLAAIREQESNAAVAAFVGAASTVGALLLLGISGVGVNPARSLGTALFADTDPHALGQVWAFILVPIAASFAGMLVWLMIDDATIDDTIFDDSVLEDVSDAIMGDDDASVAR